MLGRLRMSTEQACDEYIELAKKVFGRWKRVIGDGASKATKLEETVKHVVGRYGGNNNPEELIHVPIWFARRKHTPQQA